MKCPNCGKDLLFELTISHNTSRNKYACSCGYTELYDPFHEKFRDENQKYIEIRRKEKND